MEGFLQAIKEGHNTTTGILNRTGIYSLNYNIDQLRRLELLKALDYKIQTPN